MKSKHTGLIIGLIVAAIVAVTAIFNPIKDTEGRSDRSTESQSEPVTTTGSEDIPDLESSSEEESTSESESSSEEEKTSEKENSSEQEVPSESTQSEILTVEFIDVGQGDSILVTLGDHALLVDGGTSKKSDTIFTILTREKITYLDYIVATHPDSDHIGGLSGALNVRGMKVGHAYCSVTENSTKTFQSFVKYLSQKSVPLETLKAGDVLPFGGATIYVLAPVDKIRADNTSIVLKIVYGEHSFLLTGDTEISDEKAIFNSNADLSATVLKVAHHGSRNATSDRFLDAVKPSYCVLSLGAKNSYGHPHPELLERIKNRGITTYRTDRNGDIFFRTDGKNLTVETKKSSNIPGWE